MSPIGKLAFDSITALKDQGLDKIDFLIVLKEDGSEWKFVVKKMKKKAKKQ